MGIFTALGYLIARAPCPFAFLMPVVSLALIIIGFSTYKVEDNVTKIWIPEKSSYSAKVRYTTDTVGGSTSSNILAISRPRDGGNIMTASHLLELQQRLNDTETLRISVEGTHIGLHDVCVTPVRPYVFPCLRMTALDCYAEGGYGFSNVAADAWRMMAKPQAVAMKRPAAMEQGMEQGLDQAVAALYIPVVKTGLAVPGGPCAAKCPFDGPAAVIASAFGKAAGTWESNADCAQCLETTISTMPSAHKDGVFVQVMDQLAQQEKLGATGAQLQQKYGTETAKDAWNKFLRAVPQLVAMVKSGIEAMLKSGVDAMFAGKTPYTLTTYAPFGSRRQDLRNLTTGALVADDVVLAAASGTCYAWDGGLAIPANLNILLYGKPSPGDFSVKKPLSSVDALQHLYSFQVPKGLKSRLASRPQAFGGPVNVTLDQAKTMLTEYKKAFEKAFSAGWDNPSSGSLEHTCFSDDIGAPGSFGNTLGEMTTQSMPLIAVFGAVTVVLSALFFLARDCISSRACLVMAGSLFALLGCFAALGLSALFGISLNVVHFWVIPFIIVGIGIDDMFMLALSSQAFKSGSCHAGFVDGFAKVAIPITMTSLVNASMFGIMAFATDIRAVYQTGYSGLIATLILYLTMLLSFSPLVLMDAQRRASRRYDCLPCKAAQLESLTVEQWMAESDKPGVISTFIYDWIFRPTVVSNIGRIILALISVGLMVVAAEFGLQDIPVGLDLDDFFPVGSQGGQFAGVRKKYFPVWPVTLNWGKLEYTNPDVQMEMAYQWESLMNSSYIAGAGLKTNLVWTAALAEWGINNQDSKCMSSFKVNTLGLRLKRDGGICLESGSGGSRCPVFAGWDDERLAYCIKLWKKTSSTQYTVLSPRILSTADGETPAMPIRYSRASGSVLFARNLWDTKGYTNLIKETRAFVDDNKKIDSWMSGTPYTFWEQYLEVINVLLRIGGLSIAAGFVISLAFVLIELSSSGHGSCLQRLGASSLAALLISLVSIASMVTVVGFCSLADIKLSGFTAISCVMSTGLAVEYSVHIVHRFLDAPPGSATDRVDHAMSFLFTPSAMAFITSALSIVMMGFSDFKFVRLYFFAPLAIAVVASYFFGAVALPCLLGCLSCVPSFHKDDPNESGSKSAGEADAPLSNIEDIKAEAKPPAALVGATGQQPKWENWSPPDTDGFGILSQPRALASKDTSGTIKFSVDQSDQSRKALV